MKDLFEILDCACDWQKIRDWIKRLYKLHGAGGALHIVVDDFNVDDRFIRYCLLNLCRLAETDEEKELCASIAFALLLFEPDERYEIITGEKWESTEE